MKKLVLLFAILLMAAASFAGISLHSFGGTSYTVRINQQIELMNFTISVTPMCTESYSVSWITIAAQEIDVSELNYVKVTENGIEIPTQIFQDDVGQVININFINNLTISGSPYLGHDLKIYATPFFLNDGFHFTMTGIQSSAIETFGLPISGNWINVVEITGNVLNVPLTFPSIQSAITAAVPGDTVLVAQASYFENINFLGKSITVASEFINNGQQNSIWNTVICGNGAGSIATFENNENRDSKLIGFRIIGGNSSDYGGGIKIINTSPTISNCIINANHANISGGGLYISLYGNGIGTTNPRLQNCLISENSSNNGAGISISGGSMEIVNCTINNNLAITEYMSDIKFAGLYMSSSAKVIISNSIVFENYKTNYVDNRYSNIGFCFAFTPDTLVVVYSNVQGGLEDVYTAGNGTICWLDGNIDQNPNLNDNYNLSPGSPCIDAGRDVFFWEGVQIINLYPQQYSGSNPDMGFWESNYTFNDDPTISVMTPVLAQNSPNPFNPTTAISYSLPKSGTVTIDVYNAKGQLIRTLVNETRTSGNHSITWNGTDYNNRPVSNGIYFYKMVSDNFNATKKMMLMK